MIGKASGADWWLTCGGLPPDSLLVVEGLQIVPGLHGGGAQEAVENVGHQHHSCRDPEHQSPLQHVTLHQQHNTVNKSNNKKYFNIAIAYLTMSPISSAGLWQ